MKRTAVIVATVVLGLVIIYLLVWRSAGDVQVVLTRQETTLRELKEALDTMESGLPEIQREIAKSRDSLFESRETFRKIGQLLKPEERQTLTMAYKLAETDLTISLSHLTVAKEVLSTLQTIQDLLQQNHADFRRLMAEAASDQDVANALRNKLNGRLKRADDLMKISDRFTEDLGKFVLLQEQNWLSVERQVANLKALAQGDPNLKDRFHAMTFLLELSGTAINYVRKIQAFLENVPRKQKDVARTQQGLLSVSL